MHCPMETTISRSTLIGRRHDLLTRIFESDEPCCRRFESAAGRQTAPPSRIFVAAQRSYDPCHAALVIRSELLIRSEGKTILGDACKRRSQGSRRPFLSQARVGMLAKIRAAGCVRRMATS